MIYDVVAATVICKIYIEISASEVVYVRMYNGLSTLEDTAGTIRSQNTKKSLDRYRNYYVVGGTLRQNRACVL